MAATFELQHVIKAAFSAGNLMDGTAMASRAANYAAFCQVSAADVVLDNTAALANVIDFELVLGSITWTVNDFLVLYAHPSLDGTNYPYTTGTLPAPIDLQMCAFQISSTAEAGARRLVRTDFPLGPYKYKFSWQWKGTNTLAASGSTLSYTTRSVNYIQTAS